MLVGRLEDTVKALKNIRFYSFLIVDFPAANDNDHLENPIILINVLQQGNLIKL